jgi:hypothetical protein
MALRTALKALAPDWVLALRTRLLTGALDRKFRGQRPEEVFSTIYRERLWRDPTGQAEFFSGTGSHEPGIVEPYVAAVSDFLERLPVVPNAVDLGCGDFNVGRRLRPLCGRYVACDVVPDLIARNSRAFAALDVEFRQLDIAADPLPGADIAFLRQVLQHLGNDQVAAVVAKLHNYRYVVLTEHLPTAPGFAPNLAKPAGPGTRLARSSGLVLTESPFNLRARDAKIICSIEHGGGLIQTIAYTLS